MRVIYDEFKGFSVERKKFSEKHTMGVPHYHNAYEIFLPIQGMLTLLIGDEIIATDNTNIVVTEKCIPHGNFSKSEHERVVIYFDDDFLNMFLTEPAKDALLSSFKRKIVTPDKYDMKRTRQIAKRLEEIFISKESLPEIFVLLNEMLIIINNSSNTPKQESHRINSTLGSILIFITISFPEIQSVKELSERFFISEAYLCRLFKEGMGVTVTEYINTVRINEACDRLKNSSHTMTEIASDIGYNSYTYFCKMFRKHVGVSPYEYRKNIRGV